jgi:uncharacterized protein (DUF488 family)
VLYTLGHSTATREAFLELARPLDVLVDVRAFPGSRRSPHFAREELARWLPEAGLVYEWLPALGGRRRSSKPAASAGGWQDPSFAAYAAATGEPEWLLAAETLLVRAGHEGPPALGLLCAETLWWRCHRSLIADFLVWRGAEVWHLRPGGRPQAHSRAAGPRLERYPPAVLARWGPRRVPGEVAEKA